MQKRANSNYTVGLISLGCPKNQVDSEMILANLKNSGFKLSTDIEFCDIIIINTCGFIESAKEESINNILDICRLKNNEFNLPLVVVIGCLAERYKEEIQKEIPEVDVVAGLGSYTQLVDLILDGLKGQKKSLFLPKENMILTGERVLTTPSYYSYLKIADGCNNRCAYCAIPFIRGKYRSVPKEEVIKQARWLASQGVKELNIIAQDTTCYGLDLYGKFMLPSLLKEICKIEGIEWVRILYGYPDKISDELIDVIATEEKIVKYIDIPFQHINNQMLKSMNRIGDENLILNVISKLRSKIPNIIIRTTFITGFPGESDEYFSELLNFIKTAKLQRVGFFKYSKEEGTAAYNFLDQISEDVKNKRLKLLTDAQDEVLKNFNTSLKGKKLKILVEGYDDVTNLYYGRSYMDAPEIDSVISFSLPDDKKININIGDFIDVVI